MGREPRTAVVGTRRPLYCPSTVPAWPGRRTLGELLACLPASLPVNLYSWLPGRCVDHCKPGIDRLQAGIDLL